MQILSLSRVLAVTLTAAVMAVAVNWVGVAQGQGLPDRAQTPNTAEAQAAISVAMRWHEALMEGEEEDLPALVSYPFWADFQLFQDPAQFQFWLQSNPEIGEFKPGWEVTDTFGEPIARFRTSAPGREDGETLEQLRLQDTDYVVEITQQRGRIGREAPVYYIRFVNGQATIAGIWEYKG